MNVSPTPTPALWVSNVAPECKDQLLRTAFGCFGAITTCQVFSGRGLAYLVFSSLAAAMAAKEALHGKPLGGAALSIQFAQQQPLRDGPPATAAPVAATAPPATAPTPAATALQLAGPPHPAAAAAAYAPLPTQPVVAPMAAVPPSGPVAVPTEPPDDPFAKMVIDKFADAFLKHGPYVQDLARLHHSQHPHLQFLAGPSRPGYHYYQWRVHCLRSGISDEQAMQAVRLHRLVAQRPPPPGPDHPLAHVQGPDYFQTMEQPDGLNCIECVETLNLVSSLCESRESIKTASTWIISLQAKSRYGIHVLEQTMYDPVFAAAPEKKLLLVFVLSDIIHVCGKRATEEEVAAYDAVRVFMPRFVLTALTYQPVAATEKIGKIVGLWDTKGALDEETLQALRAAVEQARQEAEQQEQAKQAWEQYYQTQAPPGPAMAAPHSPPPAYAAYGPPVPGPYVPAPGGLPHPGLAHPHPHAHPRSPDAYAPPQPGFPPHAAAMAAAVAPARPEPPPGRVEEWLSAGFYSGLQRSVESPYTPLNPALAPKVNLPPVTQNVLALPRRVRDALEDFYKEVYPDYGVDTPANVRDFYLEKGPGPGPEAAAVAANGGEPFPAPRAVPVGGRTNGH